MKCNYPIWSPICPYHYNGECFREHNYECPALAMKNLSNGEMAQIAEEKKNKTPRYIDANKLIDLAMHEGAYGYVDVHDIYNAPTADIIERKRGKWVRDEFGSKCSCCGLYAYRDKFEEPWESNYCPNCGCAMKGAKEQ